MAHEGQPQVINRAHVAQSMRNHAAVTEFLEAKSNEVAQPAIVAQQEPVQVSEPAPISSALLPTAEPAAPVPANEFGTAWPTAEPVAPAWSTEVPVSVEPTPAPAPAPSRRSRLSNWFERAQDAVTDSRAAHLGKAALGLTFIAAAVTAGVSMDLKAGERNNTTATAAEPLVDLSPVALTTENTPTTVNAALVEADIDNPAERRKFLLTATRTPNGLKLANYQNRMNALDKEDFQAQNITPDQAIAGVGLGAFSDTKAGESYGDAIINFNSRQDREIDASTGMTESEEQAYLRNLMTKKGGKTYIIPYTGLVENGYTDRTTKEADAEVQHFQDIPVLVREVPGMGTNMWKIGMKDGIICLNPIRPIEEQPAVSVATTPGTITRDVPVFVNQPTEGITQQVVNNERDGIQVGPGQKPKPQRPGAGTTPGGTNPGGETPKDKADEKDGQKQVDHGGPGANNDHAGQGPAGQPANEAGYIPSETPPPAPEPMPTPAPLPTAPETRPPEAPAAENPIPAPTGPGTPGAGSAEPTPTTEVEIR